MLADPSLAVLEAVLPSSKHGKLFGLDLETRGTDAAHPESMIVGIGLADEDGCLYIDLYNLSTPAQEYLFDFLSKVKLVAFNVMFDGTFLQKATGKWLDWIGCSFGLFKQLSSEGHPGQSWNLETAQLEVLGWDISNKRALTEALMERGLSKGDMWKLPTEILGPYCAQDADAAWQLWLHLSDVCKDYPFLMEYHQREFMTELELLAEQQLRGLFVDREQLLVYYQSLDDAILQAKHAFMTNEQVAKALADIEAEVRAEWLKAEPPQFNKDGSTAVRWTKWKEKGDRLEYFNLNSKQQLENLFYDRMGFTALKKTEGGRRVVDKKILPTLGAPGRLLDAYNKLVKEKGYVGAALAKSAIDGLIHPQFISVGTITGRLGGTGGFNFQQQPKTRGYLSCLRARPGHRLVQDDTIALEPCVMAEFSADRALLGLYGPAAKPNDVYLYVAAKIPALGAEILKYYDPENPTKEGIAAAKKHCKKDRSVAKIVHLGSSYGAGPPKIHETLVLAGIDISLHEVKQIHAQYWKLFAGIKTWGQRLTMIWANNGGWVPSVSGRPLCVAEGLLKDIVNRHTQASGHDILQLYIWNIQRLRKERGVEMYPWLVDNHDESIWEAPEAQAEAARQILIDALAATNAELGMSVKIKGDPMIADSLADIKVAE